MAAVEHGEIKEPFRTVPYLMMDLGQVPIDGGTIGQFDRMCWETFPEYLSFWGEKYNSLRDTWVMSNVTRSDPRLERGFERYKALLDLKFMVQDKKLYVFPRTVDHPVRHQDFRDGMGWNESPSDAGSMILELRVTPQLGEIMITWELNGAFLRQISGTSDLYGGNTNLHYGYRKGVVQRALGQYFTFQY